MGKRQRGFGTTAALGLALAVQLGAVPARAQASADDKAAAEALFDDGKRLLAAKQYAEACPRFEASQRLDPGIGTLLYLADCYESQGRVASAWGTFREASAAAKTAGQADREQVARARAALLEPKLYRLTLTVGPGEPAGLTLKRNGVEVKREVWNLPFPVDPGHYAFEATAPGKKPWSLAVDIPVSPGAQAIAVPPLADLPVEVTPVAPPAPPRVVVTERPPAPPPEPEGSWSRRRTAVVILGTGVAGAVVGTIFGAQAISKNNQAASQCQNDVCPDNQGVGLTNQAKTAADTSTVAFALGGAAIAGGLVLLLTAPSSRSPARAPDRAWVAPAMGPGAGGLAAGGVW
jgi:tetratricopeptide (TPR) repeat protein